MKRMISVILIVMVCATVSFAVPSSEVRIKDQVLTYSAGSYLEGTPIPLGYDAYGYNYQAQIFNGYYCNVYFNQAGFPPYDGNTETYLLENPGAENHWAWEYRDTWLLMKWNDAWMDNVDSDGDGRLDRHMGFDSYIDSGAWETNHMLWTDEDGEHEYFVKIVAVTSEDVLVDGYWYTATGIEIGPMIWGEFAIIQEVEDGNLLYHTLYKAGLGIW